MKREYLQEVLEKFAVSGAMYSRALAGAAQRSGGRVAPQLLSQVAAQPRAKASPFLAGEARAPGALTPNASQQGLQHMMEQVPFAGHEYHEGARYGGPQTPGQRAAVQTFEQQVQQSGRAVAGPTTQQLHEHFGTPEQFMRGQFERAGTAVSSDPSLAKTWAGSMSRPQVGQATPSGTVVARPRRKMAGITDVLKSVAPWALGIGVPAATIGGLMLSKPGIQASLKEKITSPGPTAQKDLHAPVPDEAQSVAERAHRAILERGLDPASLRIAVDAPPGAGKSTLAKALVSQMGVKHYGLDWLPEEQRELGGGHLEKMVRPPRAGEVLEHHNLLRTHDPELFDAALYIAKDPEAIKRQVIERGRSAGLADFYNYPKTIGVGHAAFDTLGGDVIPLGGDAYMKLRPREGWGQERLEPLLQQRGIDPAGLSRHEKLLSLYEGKRSTGHGWLPYAKNPLSTGETALALGSIPLGVGAALAARKLLG